MSCGIYKITNILNNKIYIGQSKYIEKRWNNYYRLDCKDQPKLFNAITKYGLNNFKFDIIETCEPDLLNQKEKEYIIVYNSIVNGYNCNEGGDNAAASNETKLKMSKSMKKLFIEGKRSLKGNKNPFYGKRHNEKTIKIIKEKRKNQICSKETRSKMSIKRKGKTFSESHKRNKSIAQMGNKNPIARAVEINGKLYKTITEASIKLNIKYKTLHFRCNSKSFPEYKFLEPSKKNQTAISALIAG